MLKLQLCYIYKSFAVYVLINLGHLHWCQRHPREEKVLKPFWTSFSSHFRVCATLCCARVRGNCLGQEIVATVFILLTMEIYWRLQLHLTLLSKSWELTKMATTLEMCILVDSYYPEAPKAMEIYENNLAIWWFHPKIMQRKILITPS